MFPLFIKKNGAEKRFTLIQNPRLIFLVLSALFFTSASGSEKFVEGEHFESILPTLATAPPLGQVEVLEFFWYGCPHCFEFEGHITKWIASKKDYVSFARVPAVFSEDWMIHAKAFYAAIETQMIKQSHFALFNALHEKQERIYTETEVIKFFVGMGAKENEFTSSFNSFATATRAQRAQALTKKTGISGVPSIVINGKYRSSARMAGGYGKLLELVDFLADKEFKSLD